jgi:hypothetical protein
MQNPSTSRIDARARPGWRLQRLAARIASLAPRCPETLAGEPPLPAGRGPWGRDRLRHTADPRATASEDAAV